MAYWSDDEETLYAAPTAGAASRPVAAQPTLSYSSDDEETIHDHAASQGELGPIAWRAGEQDSIGDSTTNSGNTNTAAASESHDDDETSMAFIQQEQLKRIDLTIPSIDRLTGIYEQKKSRALRAAKVQKYDKFLKDLESARAFWVSMREQAELLFELNHQLEELDNRPHPGWPAREKAEWEIINNTAADLQPWGTIVTLRRVRTILFGSTSAPTH